MDLFLMVRLGLPFLAVLSSALATVSCDLRIVSWEVRARLRLPVPPWTLAQQLVAAARLGIAAMPGTGHLAADCVFGFVSANMNPTLSMLRHPGALIPYRAAWQMRTAERHVLCCARDSAWSHDVRRRRTAY